MTAEKLGLIGRDRALIEKLAKQLYGETARRGYRSTELREIPRGNWFEVLVAEDRWVARVEITLDRVEAEPVGP